MSLPLSSLSAKRMGRGPIRRMGEGEKARILSRREDKETQSGTTAIVSISTLASAFTKAVTSTTAMAG